MNANEPFVVGNTGWGGNNKVLRKSNGNRENPIPEVARTPLTCVGQALPGPSTPSLFIYSLIETCWFCSGFLTCDIFIAEKIT
jgi:hypothetical protein